MLESHTQTIIGFIGFAGSGKGTASDVLVAEGGYLPMAFGTALKDCCAAVFRWPRHLLEGDTKESREWRETVDPFWAERLGIPDFTPRKAMQRVGTDLFRNHFHTDTWITAVDKDRIGHGKDAKIVFTDVRHPNEIRYIKERGGEVYRVRRGPDPDWSSTAVLANRGDKIARAFLEEQGHHESEWYWIGVPVDGIIENDADIPALQQRVREKFL